jgi:hypothetical protein
LGIFLPFFLGPGDLGSSPKYSPKIIAVFLPEGKWLLLTPLSPRLKLNSPEDRGDIIMADKTIVFSDQEQMQAAAIVIDKDGAEALRFLASLMERIKGHPGHACGPKASG